jgi:F0F1-type ATP synthase delta subunit
MTKKMYTAAALELLDKGASPDEVLSGLKRVLLGRGHQRLLRPILVHLLDSLSLRARQTPIVTFAKEEDGLKFDSAVKASLRELDSREDARVTVNDTIIGGYVASFGHKRIDHSYKRKLLSIYTNSLGQNI